MAQRATPQHRLIALVAMITCFVLTLYFSGMVLNLSTALGGWAGLQEFQQSAQQAQWLRVGLGIMLLLLQLAGGLAAGVTFNFEGGSIRNCIRQLPTLGLGFFCVSAILVLIGAWMIQPKPE